MRGADVLDRVLQKNVFEPGGAADKALELFRLYRLVQKLMGRLDRAHDHLLVRMPGQDDPDGLGIEPAHLAQKFRPIESRHAHVGNGHVKGPFGHHGQPFPAAGREGHVPLVAHVVEHPAQGVQDILFVVDKEYAAFHSWPSR